MSDNLSPVRVEQEILNLNNRIAKGIAVCNELYKSYQEADRIFDREYASEYLTAPGPIKDREQIAKLNSMSSRELRDDAEAKYKHADRLAKALELELRAWQSIGASLRTAYGVAGRGEV